ncbi:MAG TPA: metal-dependent hydrolase [Longimicrobiales bacterium]
MFLGHYGVALAAKGTEAGRRTSLGTLVFGAQLLDLLWPILLLAGVERARIVPRLMAASALDFEHYPWSHSLLMTLVWAALAGVVYYAMRRRSRAAWLLGGLVLSHWLLDLPFHRPDLPLYPGSDAYFGGGLWNSVAATLAIEGLLFATGVAVYARTTRARDRIGSWGLWAGVALLVVFYAASFAGTPPDTTALAIGGLTLWLLVPWAAWIDRHRASRVGGER